MKTITARFPGFCRRCRRRILAGQPIVHIEPGRSVHADCDQRAKVQTSTEPSWLRRRPELWAQLEACERSGFR